jgi:hypothetical protein
VCHIGIREGRHEEVPDIKGFAAANGHDGKGLV